MNSASWKFIVCHPTIQHAHQLAWGLEEAGFLHCLYSGIPVRPITEPTPKYLPRRISGRFKYAGIPSRKLRTCVWPLLKIKLGGILPFIQAGSDYDHRQLYLFDKLISRKVAASATDAVVCFENSALETFRLCKERGVVCILDAPSLHHIEAGRLLGLKSTPFLSEINRRKDAEIALADLIITCSDLARNTYIQAGVPEGKVVSMRLGASKPKVSNRDFRRSHIPSFIFAGTMGERKSIDLILAAFGRINCLDIRARLVIAGGSENSCWVKKASATPGVDYRGSITQDDLYNLIAISDCLLLPSRFDAFGMVVAEAFACGTPVIVSNQCGAAEILNAHPNSGWIISPNLDSLTACLTNVLENPHLLISARKSAVLAFADCTWEGYRRRIGELFRTMHLERK